MKNSLINLIQEKKKIIIKNCSTKIFSIFAHSLAFPHFNIFRVIFTLYIYLKSNSISIKGKKIEKRITKKKRKNSLQTSSKRRILAVEIGNPGSNPKPLVESLLHIVGNKLRAAERACLLIVVHPTVEAAPVEYVPAVRQPSDLVVAAKFVQTHRAILRRVHLLRQIRELHYR